MKKACFTSIIFLFFIKTIFAKTNPAGIDSSRPELKQNAVICFTENKGQVHDQNYQARQDVLYGVMTGNLAVHLKTNGVSYQLYAIDSYKEVEDIKTNRIHLQPDKQTIYRIDLNWINLINILLEKQMSQLRDTIITIWPIARMERCA